MSRRQQRRSRNTRQPTRRLPGSWPNLYLQMAENIGLMNNDIILVYPLGVLRDSVAYTAQVTNRRLGRSVNGVRLHTDYIRVRYCVSNVYENVFVGRCTELIGNDNRRVTRSEAQRIREEEEERTRQARMRIFRRAILEVIARNREREDREREDREREAREIMAENHGIEYQNDHDSDSDSDGDDTTVGDEDSCLEFVQSDASYGSR